MESAVARIWGERIEVVGASRTDAGVHAVGQTASFAAPQKLTSSELERALNYFLPAAIRVRGVKLVDPGFHARFAAQAKTYEYRVWNHSVLDPFLSDRVWHVPNPLAERAMREAGLLFVGTKDFGAFASNPGRTYLTTVRTISDLTWRRRGALVRIRITGDGFLYHMVRNIVGALVRVGKGRLDLGDLRAILESTDRKRAPSSAPPWGLYLLRVCYPCQRRRLEGRDPVRDGTSSWAIRQIRPRAE